MQGDVNREPVPSFDSCLWKGKDLFAAMEKAGDVVGLDVSFRRVIQLWNPALKNGTRARWCSICRLLKPGENALSHRHMAGAIRFILKGHGTRLIVEGESFEIGEGDFVTTPSWTWHDHENRGETMMWLDGLDAPLVRLLETDFHEPDPRNKQPVTKPEGYTLATVGALRPAWMKQDSIQPPAFCYKWADTGKRLEQSRRAARRSLRRHRAGLCQSANRRTDAADHGVPDSHAARRRKNQEPPPHRSVIYHVWRGSGVSYVGDKRYEWEQGDSFVVPLWQFHRHENTSKDPAIFFVMSDKPLMDAIGHYREEAQA